MPRFIHLNGPPGIGKSTLAARYVAEHPGALNLDIDQLRQMVGGWQERFGETGEVVRPLALAMAEAHLRGGRDVVVPQYLRRLDELERFERAARDGGAAFCEVVLMDGKEQAVERFLRRSEDGGSPWHRHVHEVVMRLGGREHLAMMYEWLSDLVAARPDAVVVPTTAGDVEGSYQALRAVLSR